MTLPTNTISSAGSPSASSVSVASVDGVSSRLANRSVTIRLISSGIVRSSLRSPASTCAMRMPSFAATIADAMVELTSPYTTSQSGLMRHQHRLDALDDARGLHRMRARAHGQILVGRGDAEITKEVGGHAVIVVLSGVHDDLLDAERPGRAMHWRELGKVRPRADDVKQFHDGGLEEAERHIVAPPPLPQSSPSGAQPLHSSNAQQTLRRRGRNRSVARGTRCQRELVRGNGVAGGVASIGGTERRVG